MEQLPGPVIPMTTAAPSNNVRSFGYLPEQRLLRIHFLTDAIFDYHDVPPEIHTGLWKSHSKGAYVSNNIRGKFRTVLIQEKPTRGAKP